MQKKLDLFYNYDVSSLFKPLAKWEFPSWAATPVGCANLLLEQNRLLVPYIIPLQKLSSPYTQIKSVKTINLEKDRIISLFGDKYRNWLVDCKFLKELKIKFTSGLDKQYVTNLTIQFLEDNFGSMLHFYKRSLTAQAIILLNIISFLARKVNKITETPTEVLVHFVKDNESNLDYKKILSTRIVETWTE